MATKRKSAGSKNLSCHVCKRQLTDASGHNYYANDNAPSPNWFNVTVWNAWRQAGGTIQEVCVCAQCARSVNLEQLAS